jgi:hypothetical protein
VGDLHNIFKITDIVTAGHRWNSFSKLNQSFNALSDWLENPRVGGSIPSLGTTFLLKSKT